LVRKWKPDIIQANASETFKFTVISKTLFQWKALLVYRNANKVSDFIKSPLLRIINTMLSRKLDYVISVSENCRLDFIGTFHVPISRTVTIPIGTILPTEVSRSSASPVPYWISVGSLVPEKNHIGLLAIFKHYCEQGGNANLKIVGDGILKDELLKEANALGISDRILFLGYLQDVGPVMKEAIGLLLPSLIEGLPGVILESMANHVPVIAYNVGGIPEVIQHEHTGMLVLKGDESGFVDAMNNVEQKADLRIHITKNAYALCERLYSIESIAKRFLKQYDDLLHA